MTRYNLKMEVLSPLHIGTKDGEINGMEFFLKDDSVCITSEFALAQGLAREGLLDGFLAYVAGNRRVTLQNYLDTLSNQQRSRLEKEIRIRGIPFANPTGGFVNSVRVHSIDPLTQKAYLPGTTLKGALRSVLLHLLCSRNRGILQRTIARLPRARGRDKFAFSRYLEEDLLREINLAGVRKGFNTDWLRALYVSDAFTTAEACTRINTIRVMSLTDSAYHYGARGASLLVETVSPGTVFTAQVKSDDFLWEIFRKNTLKQPPDLDDILEGSSAKFTGLLDADQEYFRKAGIAALADRYQGYREAGANFRVGWGSGLLTISLALLLTKEERRDLRRAFYPKRNNPEFPQSRRVVVDSGQAVDTLGWVKLTWEKVDV